MSKARAADFAYSINGPKADGGANSAGGAKLERVGPPDTPERDILSDCMRALKVHPRVVWVERMNSGAYQTRAGHYVRFGFVGCPDIIGQLTDGRWLAVEVKRVGKNPTPEQIAFLGKVTRAGGVGFVAWSSADIARGLGDMPEAA